MLIRNKTMKVFSLCPYIQGTIYMREGLLITLAAAAFAAPKGYDLGVPSGAGLSSETEFSAGPSSTETDLSSRENTISGCGDGKILHVDGTCVVPEITRNVYLFNVPEQEQAAGPTPSIPPPAVEHNILFVRLPEEQPAPEPIVLPSPRQNYIIYVLNKQDEQVQRVIEVPAQPQTDPEIYFVNYQDGENPILPLGVDLETALSSAAAAGGQVLGGLEGEVFSGTDGTFEEAGIDGAVGVSAEHGGHVFGSVNGANGVNGAGDGLGVNGGSGISSSGLYTTP
ncbi:uncharacterized protein LOC134770706 [Penaeus indicus]|uniref:uncharacterized protein LOC134770706 n=1 Tax=Penaeus indicus TaxID=29960 RepID=UPI00300C8D42